LKNYEKEMEKKNERLKHALDYIHKQEEIAAIKQINMICDNISYTKLGEYLFDCYFWPKDKLSGDSYLAYRNEDLITFIIIDAMGKGIGASLTSTLISGLGNYIVRKNDKLNEFIDDYVNFIKKSLLPKEALCMVIVQFDLTNDYLYIANFGMPPVYVKNHGLITKIRANNSPIMQTNDCAIKVDVYKDGFDRVLMFSDGLIESPLKNSYVPYFARFRYILKQKHFLRELIRDFKRHATQEDDITMFCINKAPSGFKTIYDREMFFKTKYELDEIIEEIEEILRDKDLSKQKIFLCLQEIFTNVFEHAYREDINKEKINPKNLTPVQGWVKITLKQNDEFYYLIIEDNGKGFDVSSTIKIENEIDVDRLYKRGLFMLLNTVSGVFFENNGKKVNIFIRRDDGIK
jgi:anti-sigma regulatory factor (Ser/Thr protein kinase)